jgi:hypothetical protein
MRLVGTPAWCASGAISGALLTWTIVLHGGCVLPIRGDDAAQVDQTAGAGGRSDPGRGIWGVVLLGFLASAAMTAGAGIGRQYRA